MYAGGKREEGADVEENRPGFHSGQTGLWEQGQHQEARGRSGRVPVIRENGGGGGEGLTASFHLKGPTVV